MVSGNMQCSTRHRSPKRQRGAVLVVGLVMLVVMTMLVVSMLKTSIIDLKIGGVSQDSLINLNNADVILNTYFSQATGRFSNNCIGLAGALSCSPALIPYVPPAMGGAGGLGVPPAGVMTSPGVVLANTTPPTVTQMYCGDKPGFTGNQVGSSYQTVVLDVSIWLVSTLGYQTRIHQGIAQDLPPGACSS